MPVPSLWSVIRSKFEKRLNLILLIAIGFIGIFLMMFVHGEASTEEGSTGCDTTADLQWLEFIFVCVREREKEREGDWIRSRVDAWESVWETNLDFFLGAFAHSYAKETCPPLAFVIRVILLLVVTIAAAAVVIVIIVVVVICSGIGLVEEEMKMGWGWRIDCASGTVNW